MNLLRVICSAGERDVHFALEQEDFRRQAEEGHVWPLGEQVTWMKSTGLDDSYRKLARDSYRKRGREVSRVLPVK